jgi:proline dehydrogenase
MIQASAKAVFHLLARSSTLQQLTGHYGMRTPTSFARRFVAGETVEEAIAAVRMLEATGLMHTLDFLGEGVTTLAEADAAAREYVRIVGAVAAAGIERNLSLKLTQLGLDIDRFGTIDNLRRILEAAEGFFVRVDMESSRYTGPTIEVFEAIWQHGYRNIGIVLQADLHRTERDAERMMALGARIRLVKGAYLEPKSIAFQQKAEVDEAYVRLMERLLEHGNYLAIATHDTAIIERARQFATSHGIAPERFEFQMLYGIRRDLQSALVRQGYRVRIYVPFGREWYPYFMRRLGERPANLTFVLRSLLEEAH